MERLTASAHAVLDEVGYLFSLRGTRRQGMYLTCGRHYLAQKTGYCLRTISRATDELVRYGWLHKEQRRPVSGIYQSCIYYPTKRLLKKIKKFFHLDRETKKSRKHKIVDSVYLSKQKRSQPVEIPVYSWDSPGGKMVGTMNKYLRSSPFWAKFWEKREE